MLNSNVEDSVTLQIEDFLGKVYETETPDLSCMEN